MRRLFFSSALVLAGCGYVADPKPPALHIPQAVTDLRAVQRGDKVILEFTVPALTTESLPVEQVTAVDARGDTGPDPTVDTARRLPSVAAAKPGPVRIEAPIGDWAGQEVAFAVRIAGSKRRFSEWSNQVRLPILPPLDIPANIQVTAVSEGVRLQWTAVNERPGAAWRIYRRSEPQKEFAEIGLAEKPVFIDPNTEYGKQYDYAVKAVLKAGSAEAESEISSPVSVTPVDRFAPGTPSGLTALEGTDSIELAWDPRPEPDLRGYRLYRAGPDGEFSLIGDLLEAPAYSDRKLESGKRYRYAVSAVDRLNNESARSEPVEITSP